ncbi:MAG: general secretion pathway protein K, partial [Hyphomicrobiaceae bacterium]
MKSPDSDTRQRGIILIVVLWTVASLSLLLSTINVSVRTNNAVARAELITAKLESLADAGVELAVARLHARGDQSWLPNGQPYDVSFGGAALRIRITDANGLVDLNKADAGVLFA